MDELEQLKKDLETQTRLAEGRLEQLRYLQADFDNMRKWYEKEKNAVVLTAGENLIRDLLVILDGFEQALPAIRHEADQEGVEMVYKKMLRILGEHGLVPIDCAGKKFDPQLHEAVCREKSAAEPGTITEEIGKGYLVRSKVIRPSKVKVAEKTDSKGG